MGSNRGTQKDGVGCRESRTRVRSSFLLLVVRMFLVVRPGAPSSFLLLVVGMKNQGLELEARRFRRLAGER